MILPFKKHWRGSPFLCIWKRRESAKYSIFRIWPQWASCSSFLFKHFELQSFAASSTRLFVCLNFLDHKRTVPNISIFPQHRQRVWSRQLDPKITASSNPKNGISLESSKARASKETMDHNQKNSTVDVFMMAKSVPWCVRRVVVQSRDSKSLECGLPESQMSKPKKSGRDFAGEIELERAFFLLDDLRAGQLSHAFPATIRPLCVWRDPMP